MSTSLKVVAPLPPEVTALAAACQALAKETALDRFELAVKAFLDNGIHNDLDLRRADEMLVNVARGGDAVEAATKPAISAAHALHKALIAEAKRWKDRWTAMDGALRRAILKYKNEQAELARRRQAEIDRAADEERRRKENEARMALRNGDMAAAEALVEEAQSIVAPVISTATPKLDNSTDAQVWVIKITDPLALVKAIAQGVVPLSVIKEFDYALMRKEAKNMGGLNWPGVSARQESALRVRR
jgi:hypothetical protein